MFQDEAVLLAAYKTVVDGKELKPLIEYARTANSCFLTMKVLELETFFCRYAFYTFLSCFVET